MATMSGPTLDLATPERVRLELPLAGIGSRAIAWLIDAGLLFVAGITLYFALSFAIPDPLDAVLGLSRTARVVGMLGLFAALWGYWTWLEVAWQGQTIGKRLAGVRVVRSDGSPVTIVESAIRNLLRLVDFLPVCYPVGVVCMLIDPRHRRVGDLVAGTLLVRDEKIDLTRYEHAGHGAASTALGPAEVELVTGFLSRFGSLQPDARLALGRQLASRLGVQNADQLDGDALRARLEKVAHGETSSDLADFVTHRRPDWERLTTLLDGHQRRTLKLAELDEMDRLYRRASADLARARASFGGTDVHRALNQLCGRAYGAIYRAPPPRWAALKTFYAKTFPAAVRATRQYTLAAATLMALGTLLGALTVALDPNGYAWFVDPQLRDFIDRGALWTDSALDSHSPGEMATLIFTNNLRVSFGAFSFGVTAGLGTVLVLIFNGLHLGSVLTACFQHGVGLSLLDFMAAHGPVELSLISITGGAGLVIGHALIDPGEHTRGVWLKARARIAVRLVLGCAPFFVLIGLVEGFVSPGTFFPWPLKATLGVLAFVGFWRWALRMRQ